MELLTPAEVAKRLRVSVWTIYSWVREGRLRASKAGRGIRIERRAIDALLRPVRPVRNDEPDQASVERARRIRAELGYKVN